MQTTVFCQLLLHTLNRQGGDAAYRGQLVLAIAELFAKPKDERPTEVNAMMCLHPVRGLLRLLSEMGAVTIRGGFVLEWEI